MEKNIEEIKNIAKQIYLLNNESYTIKIPYKKPLSEDKIKKLEKLDKISIDLYN